MKEEIFHFIPSYSSKEDQFYSSLLMKAGLVVKKERCSCLIPLKENTSFKPSIWHENKELISKKTGLSFFEFITPKGVLVFLYEKNSLKKVLSHPYCLKILKREDYEMEQSLNYYFKKLQEKFKTTFPHEIGLFLGYRPEDVEVFIRCHKENRSCRSCFTHYWKVYHPSKEVFDLFTRFDKINLLFAKDLSKGVPPKTCFLEKI